MLTIQTKTSFIMIERVGIKINNPEISSVMFIMTA